LKSYGKDNVDDYISPEINRIVQAYTALPEQVNQVMQPIFQMLQAEVAEKGR
jgi:hypothetical protein